MMEDRRCFSRSRSVEYTLCKFPLSGNLFCLILILSLDIVLRTLIKGKTALQACNPHCRYDAALASFATHKRLLLFSFPHLSRLARLGEGGPTLCGVFELAPNRRGHFFVAAPRSKSTTQLSDILSCNRVCRSTGSS